MNTFTKNILDGEILENSDLIFNQGNHQDFEAGEVIDMIKLINGLEKNEFTNHFRRKVFLVPPSPSFIKSPVHIKDESLPKMVEFSRKIDQFLDDSWELVDAIPMSRKLHSFDGTHYGFNFYRTLLSVIFK